MKRPRQPNDIEIARFKRLQRNLKADKVKVELAPQSKVDAMPREIDQLLDAIASAVEEPGIRGALVTDESMLGDFLFGLTTRELATVRRKLRAALGVPVKAEDFLWQIAGRVKNKAP